MEKGNMKKKCSSFKQFLNFTKKAITSTKKLPPMEIKTCMVTIVYTYTYQYKYVRVRKQITNMNYSCGKGSNAGPSCTCVEVKLQRAKGGSVFARRRTVNGASDLYQQQGP